MHDLGSETFICCSDHHIGDTIIAADGFNFRPVSLFGTRMWEDQP